MLSVALAIAVLTVDASTERCQCLVQGAVVAVSLSETPSVYAVLTGDLVRSSRLSQAELERARQCLSVAVAQARGWGAGVVAGELDFFRGDAWQVVLADPAVSLRLALLQRALLRAAGLGDTRVAIGIGTVTEIDRAKTSRSSGQSFVASGHALDGLVGRQRLVLVLAASAPGPVGGLLSAISALCDVVVQRWTQRQAELVGLALDPRAGTHSELGARLEPAITKQAVGKGLLASGWAGLVVALEQMESVDWSALME